MDKVKLRRSKEKGFTMPLILGMGLVMILVGMTAMMRSQDDRVNAVMQKLSAKSLAIAEGSTARTLSLLNHSDNFHNLLLAENEWTIPTFGDRMGEGNYQIISYQFDPSTASGDKLGDGKLTVRATIGSDPSSMAVSQVQTIFPIIINNNKTLPNSFPALYAQENIQLGKNDILAENNNPHANIVCQKCTVPGNNSPLIILDTATDTPKIENTLSAEIGSNGAVIEGKIFIGKVKLPEHKQLPKDSDGNVDYTIVNHVGSLGN